MTTEPDPTVGQIDREQIATYMEHVERADLGGAVALVREAVTTGTPVRRLITDLLGPAQVEVGVRWQRNEWSVAQEHAATAVSDAALGALVAEEPGPGEGLRAVVVCAEEEWHVLPARMLSALLRLSGVDATFLGGSIPDDHLRGYLADDPPTAAVVSVTVPLHLLGAARTIRAAHEAGVPTIVGGRALGGDDRRARALGAAAWTTDADGTVDLLRTWHREPPAIPVPVAIPEEALRLEDEEHDLVISTMMALIGHIPVVAQFTTRQLSRTHEDLRFILGFAAAAVAVGDDDVFHGFVEWTTEVLGSRGLPGETLPRSMDALLDTLEPGRFPRTVELVAAHRWRDR